MPGSLDEFRDLGYDVEDIVGEADKVVVAYTMRASWRGERPVAIRGVCRFRVREGLTVHRVDYWDGTESCARPARREGRLRTRPECGGG